MRANSVQTFLHPVLGVIAGSQPLLLSVIQIRARQGGEQGPVDDLLAFMLHRVRGCGPR